MPRKTKKTSPKKKFTTIQVDEDVRKRLQELGKDKPIEKTFLRKKSMSPNDVLREKLGLD